MCKRLQEAQERVYDALYTGLKNDTDFNFNILRENIGTLSGVLEGFYAVLSANYLTGRMNTHLKPAHSSKDAVIGALDLGGSSTQIVFQHVEVSARHGVWICMYVMYLCMYIWIRHTT